MQRYGHPIPPIFQQLSKQLVRSPTCRRTTCATHNCRNCSQVLGIKRRTTTDEAWKTNSKHTSWMWPTWPYYDLTSLTPKGMTTGKHHSHALQQWAQTSRLVVSHPVTFCKLQQLGQYHWSKQAKCWAMIRKLEAWVLVCVRSSFSSSEFQTLLVFVWLSCV